MEGFKTVGCTGGGCTGERGGGGVIHDTHNILTL